MKTFAFSWRPVSRRVLLACLLALAAPAAMAEEGEGSGEEEEDHVRALRALEQGSVRPLSEILAKLQGQLGGDVVGIEFEAEGKSYVYEFKVVTPKGRLVSVYVDAATGAILRRKDT